MMIVMTPAISDVAAATIAMVGPTLSGLDADRPLIRLPLTSAAVPMMSGLSAMM